MVKLTKAFIKFIQCNFSGPAFVFQGQKQPPEDATLLKKRLWHRCFPVNFMKFLRTPFLTEHLPTFKIYKGANIHRTFSPPSSLPAACPSFYVSMTK